MLTAEQLEKIENAREVEVHYKRPYQYRWAVIRYVCRKNKPLKVANYYIYGEKLYTGEPLRCWEYLASTNFNVVEDGFDSEEEAITRMKELRSNNT
jgi:hypothetical protein